MSVLWQTSNNLTAAADACAQRVLSLLEEAIAAEGFASFAVSGGSTPRPLFEKLAAAPMKWKQVHVFWVDERCVPPADPASNYKLANDYLIQRAHIPETHVHRIYGEINPEEAAKRYTQEIQDFFGLEEGELPQFDVVQRGMGPDAHTASLFPGSPLIDDREGIAGAIYAPQFQQWRVTLLPGVLLAAKQTVFLVSGADKAEMVRAVFQDAYEPQKYPAQIASRREAHAEWFLDRPAAALVDGTQA
ncbi:MAG TPA: 6-phosphogluconolactonase [Bryobacteraceae bacterium]|nr:6-phosphogluconolactonase [Bryobacteraceae bacterium]